MSLAISAATRAEFKKALPFVRNIIRAGETYALDQMMTDEEIEQYFFRDHNAVYKCVSDDIMVGIYYLRANQAGGGNHVANAGFMVSENARGKGVARAMADHALKEAKAQGFEAMQFNFVVSTNEVAVNLWKKLGFNVVGMLPGAFRHPSLGEVDALVMHRFVENGDFAPQSERN